MYFPHLDQNWANDLTKYVDVQDFWNSQGAWLPLVLDLGIMLFAIAITIFCFHQLIEIVKGRKDVKDFPE